MSFTQISKEMQTRDTKIDELLLGALEGIVNGRDTILVQNNLDQAMGLIEMQKGMTKILE